MNPRHEMVLRAYICDGWSHRKIQKEILGIEAPLRGGGYEAMHILRRYGVTGRYKSCLRNRVFDAPAFAAAGSIRAYLMAIRDTRGKISVNIEADGERAAKIQQLGDLMSAVSETCYCAGWLGGTEYFVPELARRALATGEPQPWGSAEVSPADAKKLSDLATYLGHWADTDAASVGYEPFDPFPIPSEYLRELDRLRELAATTRPMRKHKRPIPRKKG